MKKCPFCAEEIQEQALKCRYCGEFLKKQGTDKWYHKISVLVIAFLCVGPLAIILVWINPRFSKKAKVILSISALIITYILWIWLSWALGAIEEYYQLMNI